MRHLLVDPLLFAAASDPAGRGWIEQIPSLIEELSRRWNLDIGKAPLGQGYHAVVLPARRGNDELALKLEWPQARTGGEVRALTAWDGHGTVRLYEADTALGALLLERLDSARTLHSLPLGGAAVQAGRLLRRLMMPAPAGFPHVRAIAADMASSLDARQSALGNPIPRSWLDAARKLAEDLARDAGETLLIHADLHYDNVLAGRGGEWVAIDPRPVAGEPEYAVPELMWTRIDEIGDDEGVRHLLASVVRHAGLDGERARAWTIVRCVDYCLWGLEHGLTQDPPRCLRILAALTEESPP
ncbi:MAG TPA: aminoglycoside phosphotransferase family protein [Chloroflexota bacterium]|nr:aminoglycoside phosphotransferase family protein [Chloroflexota bacterium]